MTASIVRNALFAPSPVTLAMAWTQSEVHARLQTCSHHDGVYEDVQDGVLAAEQLQDLLPVPGDRQLPRRPPRHQHAAPRPPVRGQEGGSGEVRGYLQYLHIHWWLLPLT